MIEHALHAIAAADLRERRDAAGVRHANTVSELKESPIGLAAISGVSLEGIMLVEIDFGDSQSGTPSREVV